MHTRDTAVILRWLGPNHWADGSNITKWNNIIIFGEIAATEWNRMMNGICGIMREPNWRDIISWKFHSDVCTGKFENIYFEENIHRAKGNVNIFTNGQIVPVHCKSQFSICLYFLSKISSNWFRMAFKSSRMHYSGASVSNGKWFGWKMLFTVFNVQFP